MKQILEELFYRCLNNNNYIIVFATTRENYDKVYDELKKFKVKIKQRDGGCQVMFDNNSKIYLVPDKESNRGFKCHYVLVDDKISHTNFRCIYEPMLVKHDDINIMWTFVQV